jgi:hypothetical protein
MKTKTSQHRLLLTSLLSKFSKNFAMLFESGSKKDFQRLKDFITS